MKFIGALLAAALALAAIPAQAADTALNVSANEKFLYENKQKPGVITTTTGLQYKILQNGFGKRPQPTDTVTVEYTGTLINGKVFDGTSPGLPASFPANKLIQGWSQALLLMREGDHWQLVIPAGLAYGTRGAGDGVIPPNQTLIFDLSLLSTKSAPKRGEPGYQPDPNDKEDQQPQ